MTMSRATTAACYLRVALLVAAGCASAVPTAHATEPVSSEALAAQATDPTAALMSFQLYDWYTPSFHDSDGTANQLVFRTAIPFQLGSSQHNFRLTAPYVTSSPGGVDGFADLTAFDLVTFDRAWGRFGVGISGTLPTGATGLRYQLGRGRSLSLANSAFVYDTDRSRWTSLLLGANYGQVVGWAGLKWRPNVELDYDFQNDRGSQEWVVRVGVALLVPAAQ